MIKTMKPILFSTKMVQAVLEGRKTQTRRIVKLIDFQKSTTKGYDWEFRDKQGRWHSISNERLLELCPYQIGDVLWVRETWMNAPNYPTLPEKYYYKASVSKQFLEEWPKSWESPIFMPREAARVFLEITDRKVERVQDISTCDCKDEGIEIWGTGQNFELRDQPLSVYQLAYSHLWDSINSKKHPWANNEWVFAYTFKRTEKP